MKRWISALLTGAMLLGLAGCTGTGDTQSETEVTAAELIESLAAACGIPPEAPRFTADSGEYDLASWTGAVYGVAGNKWEDCALILPEGAQATELAVFRLAEEADGDSVMSALEFYRDSRQRDFTGYEPEQAELVAQSKVVRSGDWVALLICADAGEAARVFQECLGTDAPLETASAAGEPAVNAAGAVTMAGRYPFTQPNLDDMTLYDTTAILTAWRSGEESGLSDKDRTILSRCREVIGEIITEGMTDYEKEAAVYCWVTTHGEYDNDHYVRWAQMDPDSYNPYGLLVNGKGVCLAFAGTFQLLMDLLEVECVTVVGAAYRASEDHAWNMVRLDGEWYCVDPTWDLHLWQEEMGTCLDYVQRYCSYFNVTSQWLADTDHQWDYTAVPEATAEDGGRP